MVMNKKAILEHYTSVIDSLINTNAYWKIFFQNPFNLEDNVYGHVEDEIPDNIDICTGVSRVCIIDHNCDWVVKFDYCKDRLGSVCDREEEIYCRACEKNLSQYFSEAVYIGDYKRRLIYYPYYKVERCCDWWGYDVEAVEDGIDKHLTSDDVREITICIPLYAYRRADRPHFVDAAPQDKTVIRRSGSEMARKTFAVAETFVANYGLDEYYRLNQFIIAENINDLHGSNVGEIDGKFCFIDYGGYHDPEYDSTYEDDNSSSESDE